MIYPYNSAQILTDEIFTGYGGSTGTSTVLQRSAAYLIAEKLMARQLSAFAPITTVTGTYAFPYNSRTHQGTQINLYWKYVQSIDKVIFTDFAENQYYTVTGVDNWDVGLRDAEYGIIDVMPYARNCVCAGKYHLAPTQYKVQVTWTAGLPTGTYTSPDYLLALTMVADIMLNEFGGCSSSDSPFVGITKFSNQQYSETRMGMYGTVLGRTPKALTAYNLVKDLVRLREVGL